MIPAATLELLFIIGIFEHRNLQKCTVLSLVTFAGVIKVRSAPCYKSTDILKELNDIAVLQGKFILYSFLLLRCVGVFRQHEGLVYLLSV